MGPGVPVTVRPGVGELLDHRPGTRVVVEVLGRVRAQLVGTLAPVAGCRTRTLHVDANGVALAGSDVVDFHLGRGAGIAPRCSEAVARLASGDGRPGRRAAPGGIERGCPTGHGVEVLGRGQLGGVDRQCHCDGLRIVGRVRIADRDGAVVRPCRQTGGGIGDCDGVSLAGAGSAGRRTVKPGHIIADRVAQRPAAGVLNRERLAGGVASLGARG